ncbi:MAG: trehalose-phosphatase [Candidatus Binatia bacterium]
MCTLSLDNVDAVLFDLDGVVTDTATLHIAAWKELFDGYLKARAEREKPPFYPFDPEAEYRQYVDGKPRYDGVKSFLESRGISLPYGDPNDTPDQDTICGIGNKKNVIFQELLNSQGVTVFEASVALIRKLRLHGVKTAIVSSSKNCAPVLDRAGLSELFDVRVDGVESARLQLPGKPAPDIFLEAARQLHVTPARAVVVEDAIAGVQAGRNGKFGLVIGVAGEGNPTALYEHGADMVVKDLGDLSLNEGQTVGGMNTDAVPSALAQYPEIEQHLRHKTVAVFLDYDGTLTPIVDRPEQALLSESMRATIRRLAQHCPVAIISGRDRVDVQRLVQLENLFYAGSHGFDIAGPADMHEEYQQGLDFLPTLNDAEHVLRQQLASVRGAHVERKKFSIAVHFRGVAAEDESQVEDIVDAVLGEHDTLRKGWGKKVFELQPQLDWHKGKALLWLLDALPLDRPDVLPLYIGDDVTDEDAFNVLADRGIGILVADSPTQTAARYRLQDPGEVQQFLQRLLSSLARER